MEVRDMPAGSEYSHFLTTGDRDVWTVSVPRYIDGNLSTDWDVELYDSHYHQTYVANRAATLQEACLPIGMPVPVFEAFVREVVKLWVAMDQEAQRARWTSIA